MKTIFLTILIGFAGLFMQPCVVESAEVDLMRANPDNLYRHVAFLTSINGYRHYGNFPGLQRCVDYIRGEFVASNGRVELQSFEVQNRPYQNVICSFGPKQGPRIVVGAHYDVCGPQPGADDNASAVAGLFEIARLMGAIEPRLKYRLDLVAYCLEEPPFFGTTNMGSYVHARKLRDQRVSIKAILCLEMIGYFSDQADSQQFPLPFMKWIYPSRANFIAVVSNLRNWRLVRQVQHDMQAGTGMEVCKLSAPAFVPGVGLSDHSSYWKFDYPSVMITDTAFYRNPNYHLPSDTIETLDFARMAEVVNSIATHLLNQQSR